MSDRSESSNIFADDVAQLMESTPVNSTSLRPIHLKTDLTRAMLTELPSGSTYTMIEEPFEQMLVRPQPSER